MSFTDRSTILTKCCLLLAITSAISSKERSACCSSVLAVIVILVYFGYTVFFTGCVVYESMDNRTDGRRKEKRKRLKREISFPVNDHRFCEVL